MKTCNNTWLILVLENTVNPDMFKESLKKEINVKKAKNSLEFEHVKN